MTDLRCIPLSIRDEFSHVYEPMPLAPFATDQARRMFNRLVRAFEIKAAAQKAYRDEVGPCTRVHFYYAPELCVCRFDPNNPRHQLRQWEYDRAYEHVRHVKRRSNDAFLAEFKARAKLRRACPDLAWKIAKQCWATTGGLLSKHTEREIVYGPFITCTAKIRAEDRLWINSLFADAGRSIMAIRHKRHEWTAYKDDPLEGGSDRIRSKLAQVQEMIHGHLRKGVSKAWQAYRDLGLESALPCGFTRNGRPNESVNIHFLALGSRATPQLTTQIKASTRNSYKITTSHHALMLRRDWADRVLPRFDNAIYHDPATGKRGFVLDYDRQTGMAMVAVRNTKLTSKIIKENVDADKQKAEKIRRDEANAEAARRKREVQILDTLINDWPEYRSRNGDAGS